MIFGILIILASPVIKILNVLDFIWYMAILWTSLNLGSHFMYPEKGQFDLIFSIELFVVLNVYVYGR